MRPARGPPHGAAGATSSSKEAVSKKVDNLDFSMFSILSVKIFFFNRSWCTDDQLII